MGINLVTISLALIGFAQLGGCGHPQSPPTHVLRRGINGEPSTLDPAMAVDSFSTDVIRDLYEGLTSESSNGDVVTGVASSWTVSADGTLYTFTLRSDARWSNGKPITAQDFVVAWRRVLDPHNGSPNADLLNVVKGAHLISQGKAPLASLAAVATGSDQLTVELEHPAPYFPSLLSNPVTYPIYSSASAKSHDPRLWVSNGPYILTGWYPGANLELKRNDYYWDQSQVHFDRVEYQIATDDEVQVKRYRANELDLTDSIPPNDLAMLRRSYPQDLRISPILGTAYLGFNMTVGPLSDVLLRQALSMAVDRRRLVSTLGLGAVEAYGFVPPGTQHYDTQQWAWSTITDEQRIAEAKRLFAQAGFSSAMPLHIRFLYNSNPTIKLTAIVIASMWKEALGIDTELIDEEYKVFLETRHDPTRWDVARFSWIADYNDAANFLNTLRSDSINNDEGYRSMLYDNLLDEARIAASANRREDLLQADEAVLLKDYPIAPLYFVTAKHLMKPALSGASPNLLNHLPSKMLYYQNGDSVGK